MKARATYTYKLASAHGHDVLVIEQPDQTGVSLTNDIENVVDDIIEKEQLDITSQLIIYKDTEGIWDGWDHVTQEFIPLRTHSWKPAVLVYITRKLRAN